MRRLTGIVLAALLLGGAGCREGDRLCTLVGTLEGLSIVFDDLEKPTDGGVAPTYSVDVIADGTPLSLDLDSTQPVRRDDMVLYVSGFLYDGVVLAKTDALGNPHGGPADVELTLNRNHVPLLTQTFQPTYKMVVVAA